MFSVLFSQYSNEKHECLSRCQCEKKYIWNWSKSLGIFHIFIIGKRDNSLLHELRVKPAVELHVNATYYAQHPALKSVYGKSQSVIGGKLFSSYRTVFELAQDLQDSKTSDLNCSYDAVFQEETLTICQYLHHFYMCSIIIISFRKVHPLFPICLL